MLDEILTYIFTKFWILYINIMLRRKGKKGVNKNMKEVYGIIRKLGLTSKYKGYYYLAEAESLLRVIKALDTNFANCTAKKGNQSIYITVNGGSYY